ncbi:hypothetical protein Sjap_026173 [Stephania japonica]|uniref:Uncharacterized protein n=1 Tax=Stephania japonica TaxID=461633 RepID=A0AAP0E6I6_9MAGN
MSGIKLNSSLCLKTPEVAGNLEIRARNARVLYTGYDSSDSVVDAMIWGIAGDLTMSIMESHSPRSFSISGGKFCGVISCDVIVARLVANYRVWSALSSNAMTKGVSGITIKLSCVSHNSRSVHIDGDGEFMCEYFYHVK